MQIRNIQVKEFNLSGDEAKLVKECLNYCWHRLSKHNDSGIKGYVDVERVDKLRRQFIKELEK